MEGDMKNRIVFLCAFAALTVLPANAQDLTFYAGYVNPGGLSLANVRTGLQLRGSGIYGFQFATGLLGDLKLEHTIAFSPRFVRSPFSFEDVDVRGFLYHSNLVLNVPIERLVPYASAGLGLVKPFGPGFQPFNTKFAMNYGGGVKLERLAGPIGLRFDVRGYAIPRVNFQTLNLFQASGGILISLGRER
jgi:hypothetical protein